MSVAIFIVVVIIIIFIVLYFINRNNETGQKGVLISDVKDVPMSKPDDDNVLIDKLGKRYKVLNLVRETPRKTYVLGDLIGKYWGEIDQSKEGEYVKDKFFNFNIYEAQVSNAISSETPFEVKDQSDFSREILPDLITIHLTRNGNEYELNLHEPKVGPVKFNRKLHQDEGTQIFGAINAQITGYVLDFVKEKYQEIVYLDEPSIIAPPPPSIHTCVIKSYNPTGKTERKGNYRRQEYWCTCYKATYWGEWIYEKTIEESNIKGCFSTLLGLIGLIIGGAFFILLLPQLSILIPIIAIPLLLSIIPSTVWNWTARIFAGFFLIAFLASILYSIINSNPAPINPIVDDVRETTDTTKILNTNDTIISHYRKWRDYDNNLYEGKYFIKLSAYQNAKVFKHNLQITGNSQSGYDEILYSLKENDKNNLNGIYQLFDSLKTVKKLNRISFSKMIVSFTQDIPYALVLPENCDPNLYADDFIKKYLNSRGSKCDGFEKFGINTPVEFLATLNGDCDTRTLLLYTILSHYNYDVALLSSEVYSHSIIGINLPLDGITYDYGNQKYVLWETTAQNIKPGVISAEISNTNNWRISLKSK